jgi:hypothetical protein
MVAKKRRILLQCSLGPDVPGWSVSARVPSVEPGPSVCTAVDDRFPDDPDLRHQPSAMTLRSVEVRMLVVSALSAGVGGNGGASARLEVARMG